MNGLALTRIKVNVLGGDVPRTHCVHRSTRTILQVVYKSAMPWHVTNSTRIQMLFPCYTVAQMVIRTTL